MNVLIGIKYQNFKAYYLTNCFLFFVATTISRYHIQTSPTFFEIIHLFINFNCPHLTVHPFNQGKRPQFYLGIHGEAVRIMKPIIVIYTK